MNRVKAAAWVACSAYALGGAARAQQAPAAADTQANAPDTAAEAKRLPEVSVSASRVQRDNMDLPLSVDTIDQRTIREDTPQVNLSETLARVPGISVLNRQNYAQDLQISSRGFGARSTFGVRGLRLIADGIPATMPDGQGQAASFDLAAAQSIEVLRGPFSSLYGNAGGGVVQIFTADGPPVPTYTISTLYGSYDTHKLDVQAGGQKGPLNITVDASRFETDGYRDHSSARREQVNAKFKYDLGSAGVFTLVLNGLDQPQTEDPLGLTAQQAAQAPKQAGGNATANAYNFNTRKSIAQNQVGLTYEVALSAATRLNARVYAGERQVTQYLAIPLATQAAPTQSGGVVGLDSGYGGVGLRLTHEMRLGGNPLTVSAGVDYDRQNERRLGYINNFGVIGDLKRNEDDIVDNTGFYAQAEWQIVKSLSLLAGVRNSTVRFHSQDYFIAAGNPDDSGSVTYSQTTPVGGVLWKLTPAFNLYFNVGHGFETPSLVELAYQPGGGSGLNFALRPSTSVHREVGAKMLLGDSGRLNLATFRIDTTNEIVTNSNSGGRADYKNAPGTRREGFELSWVQKLPLGFETTWAYTFLNARFTQSFATVTGTPAVTVTVASGARMPGISPTSLYGELVWRHAPTGFHAGVEVRASGKVWVNDQNSEFANAYTVVAWRAGLQQRSKAWRFTEFVRLDNANNQNYIGSVIVVEANNRYYEPAPKRNATIGLNAEFSF